jgi:2-succinyl-5-enolpyruvyl-6-hydroxy-3-cyclohexene-1-carboxylate synthase
LPLIGEGASFRSAKAGVFKRQSGAVASSENTDGFGIDGGLSEAIGASLLDRKDNVIASLGTCIFLRYECAGKPKCQQQCAHFLINNGKGTEFTNYGHHAARFADDADEFMAAAGHYGNRSPILVRNYIEALGFKYMSATSKEEFELVHEKFRMPEVGNAPMLLELFAPGTRKARLWRR